MYERHHIVRQCILEVLKYYKHVPVAPASIIDNYMAENEAISIDETIAQASELITTGMVENLKPGRGLLLRITDKGLRQINCEAALDEFIWGDRALAK